MMSPEQSAVFIIDDDASVRESLYSLFRSVGHLTQAFSSPREFLVANLPEMPGCLVLDVRLPGQSGLEFQREAARSGMLLPVVFITGHGDVPMSVAAMKSGAIEFLTKPFRDQDLLDAVHRGIEIDRKRRAEAALVQALRNRFNSMTAREREVMALVANGQLNKQIAAELSLSEVTVKVHRGHLMRKMQARSVPELVRMADRLAGDMPRS